MGLRCVAEYQMTRRFNSSRRTSWRLRRRRYYTTRLSSGTPTQGVFAGILDSREDRYTILYLSYISLCIIFFFYLFNCLKFFNIVSKCQLSIYMMYYYMCVCDTFTITIYVYIFLYHRKRKRHASFTPPLIYPPQAYLSIRHSNITVIYLRPYCPTLLH